MALYYNSAISPAPRMEQPAVLKGKQSDLSLKI